MSGSRRNLVRLGRREGARLDYHVRAVRVNPETVFKLSRQFNSV